MITLTVKDPTGGESGQRQIDPARLGGFVKKRLMHQAVVSYHATARRGTACTKTRAEVAGSTKKMYRQKGTGRARAGNRKSGIRRGGGVIFGPRPRSFRRRLPRKLRRAALDSALLTKFLDKEAIVIDGFGLTKIKTKEMAALLDRLEILHERVLVVPAGLDRRVYRSARNIPGVTVLPVAELNAWEVLKNRYVLFETAALDAFLGSRGASGDAPAAESPAAESPAADSESPAADSESPAADGPATEAGREDES